MRRRFSLRALVGAAAAGVLLVVGASPAASAGFAPNPGFEDDCAGIPCAWTNPPANATVSRDTAVRHEDDASLRLQITDPAAGESSVFTCIGGIGPGSYLASYWYRSTTATFVNAIVIFRASSDCSGSGLRLDGFEVAPGGSDWRRGEVAGAAPAGTQSVSIRLAVSCVGCPAGTAVNFDDLGLRGGAPGPTAIGLTSLAGKATGRGVQLRWRASGTQLLGFHVWRDGLRLTPALIAASATPSTASYRYVDRTAELGRTYVYRLEAVRLDGRRSSLGTVRVRLHR